MQKNQKCIVEGCNNPVHAKGYCRKHYGQLWRKGRIYSEKDKSLECSGDCDSDRIRALQRELKRAQTMYNNVIGFDGRIKWRREIDEVKAEMKRLGIEPVVPERPVNDNTDSIFGELLPVDESAFDDDSF